MNFALISLGCSKNLVDSENLTGILVNRKGFQLTNEIEEADLVLINTCGFIGDAKKESIETILEVAEYKQERTKKNCGLWLFGSKICGGIIARNSGN